MKITFLVNMHCAACKGIVESALKKLDGINSIDINLITNSVEIDYNKSLDVKIIEKTIRDSGYKVEVLEDDIENQEKKEKKSRTIELVKIIVGLVLLVPLMYLSMGMMYPSAVPDFLKSPIYISGYIELVLTLLIVGMFIHFYIDGFKALIKLKPNMDSLVFLASFFSIVYSIYLNIRVTADSSYLPYSHLHYFYDSAAMTLVIVSIGKLIEKLSKNKAKKTMNELLKLRPNTAYVIRNNEIVEMETKYLVKGDRIEVRPGDAIPMDGLILKGRSFIDESMLTGESDLVSKGEDDLVYAGTINKDGVLRIIVTKSNKDSTLTHIANLVGKASNMNTSLTKTVDKVSRIFTPVIMLISLIVFFIWLTIDLVNNSTVISMYNSAFEEALGFMIGVLAISCPCALGLATPISLMVGSSIFSKNGILINNSGAIEDIDKCDAIALDKTNTLTNGDIKVHSYIACKKANFDDVLLTMEKSLTHPLSVGIVSYLSDKTKVNDEVRDIKIISGKGAECIYKNKHYYVSNLNMLNEICKDKKKDEILSKIDVNGYLISYFFSEESLLNVVLLKDTLKPEALDFISYCKEHYKKIILLTGDKQDNALIIGKELGITDVIAEASPEKKQEVILNLQKEGYRTLMIGDGVNDSVALATSNVSIGLAKGSEIALTSSDFVLMNNNLDDLKFILFFSRKIKNNIKFNLFWAFIYNLAFIPIAAGAFASLGFVLEPKYCSILMAVSSVSVCLNSIFLFRFKKRK